MNPQLYLRPADWSELDRAAQDGAAYVAGATEMIPLMRAAVARPVMLIDLARVLPAAIEIGPECIAIGALARLGDVAAHEGVRASAPAICQALLASGSAQIRNMATVGGSLLQRTRCSYFRDAACRCNKRRPGSGCPVLDSDMRQAALFGASARCAAIHSSDLAVVLSALDARLHLQMPAGRSREISIHEFYRLPGESPERETVLEPGELIVRVDVPLARLERRSTFAKIRQRAAFEFSLVSVAVAVDVQAGHIAEARIAVGGVAPQPWRLPSVEACLRGYPFMPGAFPEALSSFEDDARPNEHNRFKLPLSRNLILRCLDELARAA